MSSGKYHSMGVNILAEDYEILRQIAIKRALKNRSNQISISAVVSGLITENREKLAAENERLSNGQNA